MVRTRVYIAILVLGLSSSALWSNNRIIGGEAIDTVVIIDDAAKSQSKGEPIVRIFADYSNTTSNGANENSFNITRAYFGYGYSFDDHFSGRLTLDFGDPRAGRLKRSAFLKHAYVQYQGGAIDFLRLGISSTLAFRQQESFWGYRYVTRSVQSRYRLNSSADLGASIQLKANEKLTIDGSIFNGEGFRDLQVDSSFRYSLGATLKLTSQLQIRGYWDFSEDAFSNKGNQITYNVFVGYQTDIFRIGIEYASQHNFRSLPEEDRWLVSIYGTCGLTEKINVFGRYDYLSNKNNPTQPGLELGGITYLIGGEYNLFRGICVSPNYTLFNDQISGNTSHHTIKLNLIVDL